MEARYYSGSYLRMKEGAIAPSNEYKDMALFKLNDKNFHSCIEAPITIEPGEMAEVPTGLALSYILYEYKEFDGLIRKGLLCRGIINNHLTSFLDSTHRPPKKVYYPAKPENELKALFHNIGNEAVTINNGDVIFVAWADHSVEEIFEEQEEV